MEDGGWDSLSTHPGLLWLNVVLLATVTLAWATLFCGHGGPCYDSPRHPHNTGMTGGMTALPASWPDCLWGVAGFLGDWVTQPEMWGVNVPWGGLQPVKTGHEKGPADKSLSQFWCFIGLS